LADGGKRCPACHSGNQTIFTLVYCRILCLMGLNPCKGNRSQSCCIRILLVRSWSLKEKKWQFAVNWSCSKIRRIWEP
jgi:hypothetical protein